MEDLRTTAERARDAKHSAVCQKYLDLSNKMPNVSAYRIFNAIANEFGMTAPGIRRILVENNLYKGKPHKN